MSERKADWFLVLILIIIIIIFILIFPGYPEIMIKMKIKIMNAELNGDDSLHFPGFQVINPA